MNSKFEVFNVSDESMFPTLQQGGNVACVKLINTLMFIDGDICMLVDANGCKQIKRLYHHEDGVVLVSDNTATYDGDRLYPTYKRKWDQIAAIYKVKAFATLL